MNKKIVLEIIWWLATAVILMLILLPIYTEVGAKYDFYASNIFFIVLFVTFTRWIFLTKHTFFADNKTLKLIFIFLPIPLFFYAMDSLYDFQDYMDQDNYIQMLNHLTPDAAMDMFKYIKYQYLFFGTGSIFVIFLMPIRMIVSIWRKMNRGTV